jgi:cytochrome c553
MRILKQCKYGSVLAPAVLLIIPCAYAQERSIAPAIVSRYCSGCHEMDGRSQLPYVPRLAGLSAPYLERRLANFRAAASTPVDEAVSRIVHLGGKDPGVTRAAAANMVGVAHAISDGDIKAAAQWYAAKVPAPGRSGKRRLIEEGRNLFTNGLQSQGLPACQTCHGPEAQGTDVAPRLAGQNASYLVGQLALFRAGDSHYSPEMTVVAKNIDRDQALAVAVYLQSH